MIRPRRAAAIAAAVSLTAVPAVIALGSADATTVDGISTSARHDVDTRGTDPTFTRIDDDTAAKDTSRVKIRK